MRMATDLWLGSEVAGRRECTPMVRQYDRRVAQFLADFNRVLVCL
jgi:hypothetical protein